MRLSHQCINIDTLSMNINKNRRQCCPFCHTHTSVNVKVRVASSARKDKESFNRRKLKVYTSNMVLLFTSYNTFNHGDVEVLDCQSFYLDLRIFFTSFFAEPAETPFRLIESTCIFFCALPLPRTPLVGVFLSSTSIETVVVTRR